MSELLRFSVCNQVYIEALAFVCLAATQVDSFLDIPEPFRTTGRVEGQLDTWGTYGEMAPEALGLALEAASTAKKDVNARTDQESCILAGMMDCGKNEGDTIGE